MKKLGIHICNGVFILLFASLSSLQAGVRPDQINLSKVHHKKNIVPVAIIGGGPAGLSAAVYTARAALPTYVFVGGNLGGHLNDIQQIENFPALPRTSGEAVAKRLEAQATSFGAHIMQDSITSVNFNKYPFELTTSSGDVINALTVIIATGFIQEKLDIPGTETYWGNGIGICTICDAPFALGQEVIVVGDDDFAAERVIQLCGFAKKVYMITRKNKLNVTPTVLKELDDLKNLEIITGQVVTEILGDGTKVTGANVRNLKENKEYNIPASTVYLNSVYKPDSSLVKDQLALDKEGFIIRTNGTQETSVPGVFAAGAVTNKPNKAGPSAGFGMATGVELIECLHKTIGFTPETSKSLEKAYYKQEHKRSLGGISKVTTRQQLREVADKKPITILFAYSPGCPFCRAMFPEVVEVARELQDTVTLVKLNANESTELSESLAFDSVPTTFVYKDDVLVHTIRGKTNKKALMKILKGIIAQMKEKPS